MKRDERSSTGFFSQAWAIIMDSKDTGSANPGTTNITAQATDIDTEVAGIVSNFGTDQQYQAGMIQKQIIGFSTSRFWSDS